MDKGEFIKRYGKVAYEKKLAQRRGHYKEHREEEKARAKKYYEEHPEEVKAKNQRSSQEQCRKRGKYYAKKLKAQRTGIPGDKNKIRRKHQREYKPYKVIIAPNSQIHHEWIPTTDEYRGIALVEADAHMHGFVKVIEILNGEITLLSEEEVKNGEKM